MELHCALAQHSLPSLSCPNTIAPCPHPPPPFPQVRVELYDTRRTKFIQAHDSAVACLTLSANGKLLATASEKGTLIRIFSTAEGSKLQELRRGSDPAHIYSLAFSRGERPEWLAVSSDKGTVHAFSLTPRGKQQQGQGQGQGHGQGQGQGQGQDGQQAEQQQQQEQQHLQQPATPGVQGWPSEGGESSSPSRTNPTSKLSFVSVSGIHEA